MGGALSHIKITVRIEYKVTNAAKNVVDAVDVLEYSRAKFEGKDLNYIEGTIKASIRSFTDALLLSRVTEISNLYIKIENESPKSYLGFSDEIYSTEKNKQLKFFKDEGAYICAAVAEATGAPCPAINIQQITALFKLESTYDPTMVPQSVLKAAGWTRDDSEKNRFKLEHVFCKMIRGIIDDWNFVLPEGKQIGIKLKGDDSYENLVTELDRLWELKKAETEREKLQSLNNASIKNIK